MFNHVFHHIFDSVAKMSTSEPPRRIGLQEPSYPYKLTSRSLRTMRRTSFYPALFLILTSLIFLAACEPIPQNLTAQDSLAGGTAAIPDRALQDPDTSQQQQASAPLREAARPLPAPGFALPTHEGGTFSPAAHRGEVVVINFWATWCAPCREEIPDFVELQDNLGEAGVQFVGVSLDEPSDADAVRSFAGEFDINYPVVIDDGSMQEKYGPITALPMTLIIGPQGNGRYFARGMLSKAVLKPALIDLLSDTGYEPPPSYPGS